MATTYDIFRNDPRGAIWVESAEGLAQATERLKSLNEINHTEYFAYDIAEARIVARFPFEASGTADGQHADEDWLMAEEEQNQQQANESTPLKSRTAAARQSGRTPSPDA